MYSHSDEAIEGQIEGGMKIMERVTESKARKISGNDLGLIILKLILGLAIIEFLRSSIFVGESI